MSGRQEKAKLYSGRIFGAYNNEVYLSNGKVLVRMRMYDPVSLPFYTGPFGPDLIEAGYADYGGYEWIRKDPDLAMELVLKCQEVKRQSDLLVLTISVRPLSTAVRDRLKNNFVRPEETAEILEILEEFKSAEETWKTEWRRMEKEGVLEAHGGWVIYNNYRGSMLADGEGLRKISGDRDMSTTRALRFIVNGIIPPTELPDEEEKRDGLRLLGIKRPEIALLMG